MLSCPERWQLHAHAYIHIIRYARVRLIAPHVQRYLIRMHKKFKRRERRVKDDYGKATSDSPKGEGGPHRGGKMCLICHATEVTL